MFRVILASALALVTALPVLASPVSVHGLRELERNVHRTETELKRADSRHAGLSSKITAVKHLRLYVARELQKQRDITQPDAQDDQLALALIGYDEDLGSFVDEPVPSFSEAKCAGYRIALIHDYTPAGESRAPANLPVHTQESLDILSLLCGN